MAQPSCRSAFQTVNYWQPSFSGCRHQDLECTGWRCRLSII